MGKFDFMRCVMTVGELRKFLEQFPDYYFAVPTHDGKDLLMVYCSDSFYEIRDLCLLWKD